MTLLKEPGITLEGVKVRTLSVSSIDLEMILRVTNPNIFSVTIRDLPFTILCNAHEKENQVATGNAGSVKIQGRGTTDLTIPVTVHNAGIIRAVTSFVAERGIEMTVRGSAVIDCIVACKTVPFTKAIQLTTRQITDSLSGNRNQKED